MDYYFNDFQWEYRPRDGLLDHRSRPRDILLDPTGDRRDRFLDPGSDSDSDMSWKGPHSPGFNIQSNVPGRKYNRHTNILKLN